MSFIWQWDGGDNLIQHIQPERSNDPDNVLTLCGIKAEYNEARINDPDYEFPWYLEHERDEADIVKCIKCEEVQL